jgi:ribose transport system permease protein
MSMEGSRESVRQALRGVEELGVAAALAALCVFFALTTDTFLSLDNLIKVVRQSSDYGIMAAGMVFVLTLGEVDLSVGSILTLVNVLTAVALREGAPPPVALALGLLCGAACGFANGLASVFLRIPTILVTLGTMSVYRGLALVISKATPVSQFSKDNFIFDVLGGAAGRIPASVIAMIVIGCACHVLLQRSVFGRRVQAIGSSRQAARYSGIPIARYRLAVMTLSGTLAGLAGILALAFLQSADPKTGEGSELLVIASAVIGGTALSGGSGTILGAILGALIIASIRNGLIQLGFTAYWNQTVIGGMIITAVAVDSFVKRRKAAGGA